MADDPAEGTIAGAKGCLSTAILASPHRDQPTLEQLFVALTTKPPAEAARKTYVPRETNLAAPLRCSAWLGAAHLPASAIQPA